MSAEQSNNKLSRNYDINRRKFLAAVGTGTTMSTAGCLDWIVDSGEEEIIEGASPVVGMATAPDTLNPLASSTAYSWAILDNIYSFGVTTHPDTLEPVPSAMEDWELNEENVGTNDPTVIAHLRDDMTFNDGVDVTAEDVVFTVEYIQEQQPAGSISAAAFTNVEHIGTPDPDGTEVHYYFSEPDSAWLTSVVGSIILPKHIWEDVDDYQTYTPRDSDEGIVGSGPMTLGDYDWENWFELEWRDPDGIWQTEYEWVDDGAPFIDSYRFEIFGSENAVEQAVLNGDVTFRLLSFTVSNALDAFDRDDMTVLENDDNGWRHQSFNLRRVPLDCPAFRQLLVKLVNTRWIVDDLYEGVGAVGGTYATPKPYTEWRPAEPDELSEYSDVDIPDLDFIGNSDSSSPSSSDKDEVLNFLQNHPRAEHDYSYGSASSGAVEGDEELYVNGEPLSEAHTDNDGNDGQGPLTLSLRPPEDNPNEVSVGQQTAENLNIVGIPAEYDVIGFNELQLQVYADQSFDIFMMGWDDVGVENTHYYDLFHSDNADLTGESDALMFNAMGYTGANDLIEEDMMELDQNVRPSKVRDILARIWADAPTNVVWHERMLQPISNEWDGYVETVGGISNGHTPLNIRRLDE